MRKYSGWVKYKMKRNIAILFFTFLQFVTCLTYSQTSKIVSKSFINPTDFYELKGTKKGDETYGYFGTIKVKLLSDSRIIISFFICKGYMSYNSGSFYDTLKYKNNSAEYKTEEFDPSCNIKLRFTNKGLFVDEQTNDYNFGCGFGHGVVSNDFFKLNSRKTPTRKELAEQ